MSESLPRSLPRAWPGLLLLRLLLCAVWVACLCPAQANPASPGAANPTLEKHVMQLAQELRCLVCQNQTIADSQAPLAIELKNQVREQLAEGRSDQQVIAFMVQRYGDFVLYRPPVKASTWLLWFGPFLLLLWGLLTLILKLHHKRTPADTLTSAELAHANALLTENPHPGELP